LRKAEGPEYFGEDGGWLGPIHQSATRGHELGRVGPESRRVCGFGQEGAGWWRRGRGRAREEGHRKKGKRDELGRSRLVATIVEYTGRMTNEGLCCLRLSASVLGGHFGGRFWAKGEDEQEQDDQGQRMESGSLCLERKKDQGRCTVSPVPGALEPMGRIRYR
jgi:hypothetical protein